MTVHCRTTALERARPELLLRAALTCALAAACAPPLETESPTATAATPSPSPATSPSPTATSSPSPTTSPALDAPTPATSPPPTATSPPPTATSAPSPTTSSPSPTTSPALDAPAPATSPPPTATSSPSPTTSPALDAPAPATSPPPTATSSPSPTSLAGGPAAATPSPRLGPADSASTSSPARALDDFARDTPRCRPAARHCVGIYLHIVVVDGEPVQDTAWLSRQVDEAQERFAPIDVALEIRSVAALPADRRAIVSRSDRDRLGDGRFAPGLVHVFVVGSLADVDGPGEIRGVHWRQRGDRERRWVILSSIAGPLVLTHELGHFFGLPHSTYPASVMNKTEGPDRPLAERGFHERELQRMRRQRDAMLASGMIKDRKRRP